MGRGDYRSRLPLIERFVDKVDFTDSCWLWTDTLNPVTGYGRISINNRRVYAHRFSHELFKGPIPAGYEVDHLCRVRHCVNPDHLEAVTKTVNIRRADANKWKRELTHCKWGHEFTE